jgi:hypothetical protein
MPADERQLLAKALWTNLQARVLLAFWSIDRLRAWASLPGTGHAEAERVIWAGRAASRRLPFATCLSSALALQRCLSRHGHACELHIGVARENRSIVAHAWIEREGRIVLGEDERQAYTRLLAWPAGERPYRGLDRR